MDCAQLSVGDRVRHHVGLAIVGSLAVAATYAVLTVLAKETPALYLHQPWQDDPERSRSSCSARAFSPVL